MTLSKKLFIKTGNEVNFWKNQKNGQKLQKLKTRKSECSNIVRKLLIALFLNYFTSALAAPVVGGEESGSKMIDSQGGAERRVVSNHLVSNKREWNNCFIKNNHEKMLNLADLVIFSFLPLPYL